MEVIAFARWTSDMLGKITKTLFLFGLGAADRGLSLIPMMAAATCPKSR
jgi:hypothetical protein